MADGTLDPNAKPTEEISVREVFGIDTDMVVRGFAEGFSWKACAEDFVKNLQPYPEPEKTRFWRRLRRLTRVRRRRVEATA